MSIHKKHTNNQVNTYKFRLYPTKTQEHRLEQSLDTCRNLYNWFVFESRLTYKEGYKMKFDEMQRIVPAILSDKKEMIYSKVAQMVLWQFYNNLSVLKALAQQGRSGRIRYKSRSRFNSISYNQSGFYLDNCTLKLSKIGRIKINTNRQIIGKIKQITIKKEIQNWYACIMAESERKTKCLLERKKIIGIDVGITNFAYDSDGCIIKHPQILKKSEERLKKAQHVLSKKIIHSNNRFKQRAKLGRIHKKIKNQRNDFLHKISRYYVNNYDAIFVEDLRIQHMVKNHNLAKSISDSSWYSFFQKLEYKAERAGILFRKVPAAGTSQMCSRCSKIVQKTLAQRTHSCPSCGLIVDRDHNAALNIKQIGMDGLPMGCREVTPVEIVPLPVTYNRQDQSTNQEAYGYGHG